MSIGMAILLNMGTNYFSERSLTWTKALSAVLQLAGNHGLLYFPPLAQLRRTEEYV